VFGEMSGELITATMLHYGASLVGIRP
jgi:hypothetical protein